MSETLAPAFPARTVIPSTAPSAQRLSLRANFAWTLAGNVVYAGCQWGMLIALAKLGTPEWVGQFALGLALTAPVLLFANLQLRSIQATDVSGEYQFGHYLALRLIMLSLAVLVIPGILLTGGYKMETCLVVAAVGLAKVFESISDVFYGLLQKHERMDRIAKSMMIKGPVSLLALALGTYLTRSVVAGVLAMAGVWFALLVLYDMRSGRIIFYENFRPAWNSGVLKKLAWLAAPLGVVMMLNSLNANIPRYVIEHQLGQWELGIFAALAYLQAVESTIVNALGQSATPRLAAYCSQGKFRAFRHLNLRMLAIGGLIGGAGIAVALVAGKMLLTFVYRAEYAAQNNVFAVLMIGAALSNVAAFLGYGLTAARRFRIQMPLLIGESVLLTAICPYLVPRYGLQGAAIAYVIAKGFLIAVSMMALYRPFNNASGGIGSEAKHACG